MLKYMYYLLQTFMPGNYLWIAFYPEILLHICHNKQVVNVTVLDQTVHVILGIFLVIVNGIIIGGTKRGIFIFSK